MKNVERLRTNPDKEVVDYLKSQGITVNQEMLDHIADCRLTGKPLQLDFSIETLEDGVWVTKHDFSGF